MASRAPDAAVLEAARRVLEAHPTVVSQRRMGELVGRQLQKDDPDAAVTGDRVRKLLVEAPFCRLEYRTREEPRSRAMYSCPICGGPLSRLKNQTLFGGEVTLTIRCTRCRYWSGRGRRVPTLYTFHWRGQRSPASSQRDDGAS